MYRVFCQGWDRGRKNAFIAHLRRLRAVMDAAGSTDVLVVCLVDAPPYEFAFELAAIDGIEPYVSVIPEGRQNADDNIHTGELGIPDPGVYAAFCTQYIQPGKGVGLYVNNEPNVRNEAEAKVTFTWLAEVGEHLAALGHFAVLGNFANTWPTEEMLKLPEAKHYMQVLGNHRDKLRNGAHEYAPDLPSNPFGSLGSWKKWVRACQYHEIPTFETIITEGVWDGEKGTTRGIAEVMARWAGSDQVKQVRAAREYINAIKAHYIHPLLRGWCFYIWTAFIPAANNWWTFNPSELTFFLDELVRGFGEIVALRMAMNPVPEPKPEEPIVDDEMKGRYVIGGLAGRLNARREPAGEIVGTYGNGDVVTLTGDWEGGVLNGVEHIWLETINGLWIAHVDGMTLEAYEPPDVDVQALRRELVLLRERMNSWVLEMLEMIEEES